MTRGTDAVGAGGFSDLLRSTVERLKGDGSAATRDALLFLGQRHQAFAALIVRDPILEPVDKIVWMTLWQYGGAGQAQAAFPSYAEIAANAHVRSKTTISRALAILRITRWISLCAMVRGRGGQFRGHVYAVHDEPQSLSTALALDATYMKFVEAGKTHPHGRVQAVAQATLESLRDDIKAGVDVTAPTNVIAQRLQTLRGLSEPGTQRYFSFTPRVLANLNSAALDGEPDYRVQNPDSVDRVQILDPVGSSSCINKTTTTETDKVAPISNATLLFPPILTENQRAVAVHYLDRVPEMMRQAVLDELEGRLRASRHGAKPLYDPVRYLYRLCAEVVEGRFIVNLGEIVRTERERRSTRAKPVSGDMTDRAQPSVQPIENNPVDAIRSQFSLPTRLKAEKSPTQT